MIMVMVRVVKVAMGLRVKGRVRVKLARGPSRVRSGLHNVVRHVGEHSPFEATIVMPVVDQRWAQPYTHARAQAQAQSSLKIRC